jgi:hypothetical protein
LLTGREELVAVVEALLFRHDPIGINFETNTDEYEPEAETIVLRLPAADNETDALKIIYGTFVEWFDDQIAGPNERYHPIAEAIWALWIRDHA